MRPSGGACEGVPDGSNCEPRGSALPRSQFRLLARGEEFSGIRKKPVTRARDTFVETFGRILKARLGGDGRVELCEIIRGNVNRIYKIRYAGRTFGVRVATHQYRFKYEKDIIKEVFAICLLNSPTDGFCDRVARDRFARLARSPTGADLSHDSVRRIVYYDWRQEAVPYSFFIYEWVEGRPLWKVGGEDDYFLAGQDLARLHRVRFEHYYQDLYKIGHEPLDWASNFRLSLRRELALRRTRLAPRAVHKVESLDVSGLPSTWPRLVHNDYSGANIIVSADGRRSVIDWDNWVVDAPELDLVKMKYWTAIGPDDLLRPHAGRFDAFLEGYRSAGTAADLDAERFRAYEGLWLIRAFNFESAREESQEGEGTAGSWAAHYPPPRTYEGYLVEF